MSLETVTHLNFKGQAREALSFYHSVFGGEATVVAYGDLGHGADASDPQHVMWGQVASPDGFRIMAYDVQAEKPWHPGENAFYVALRGSDADEVQRRWDGLQAGAAILTPLGPAPWSPLYGMLRDRFGITWIMDVNTAGA